MFLQLSYLSGSDHIQLTSVKKRGTKPRRTNILANRALSEQEEIYTPVPIERLKPPFRSVPLQFFWPPAEFKLEGCILVTTSYWCWLLIRGLTKVENLRHPL